jgi:NAD(P)-dependent dehydrogenase (short-subunit alcohol dehydrogenase family)
MAAQAGRVAVVTGANSGIGLVAARELARKGARVVLAVRAAARGEEAAAAIRQEAPGAQVEVLPLDLTRLASVREAAAALAARHPRVHLLVNNAGVMAVPRSTTADGFELQLGTNHLGHFALTGLLLPLLVAAGRDGAPARVVSVSSNAHKFGRIRFDDLMGERRYTRWGAYGQSKLANLLFTLELERRARAAGLPLLAAACHPGYAATNLTRAFGTWLPSLPNRLLAQPAHMGALPTLYAATAPDVQGGDYVGPGGFLEQRGYPKKVGTTAAARDAEVARRLWEVSEDLTGVRYAFAS